MRDELAFGAHRERKPRSSTRFHDQLLVFTVIAMVAHVLVWQWRPWLPVNGMLDGLQMPSGVPYIG